MPQPDLSSYLSKQPPNTSSSAARLEQIFRQPSATTPNVNKPGLENAFINSPSGNLPPPPETYTPPPGFAENPASQAVKGNFSNPYAPPEPTAGFSAPAAEELIPPAAAATSEGGGLAGLLGSAIEFLAAPEVFVPLALGGVALALYLAHHQGSPSSNNFQTSPTINYPYICITCPYDEAPTPENETKTVVYGPVTNIQESNGQPGDTFAYNIYCDAYGKNGEPEPYTYLWQSHYKRGRIVSFDPASLPPQPPNFPPPPTITNPAPITNPNQNIPAGTVPSAPPNNQNNKAPFIINISGGTDPFTITPPGQLPVTFNPGGSPSQIKIPDGSTPFPNGKEPFSIGPPSSSTPNATSSPGVTLSFPPASATGGQVTINIPGSQPIVFDPTGLTQPTGLTPVTGFDPTTLKMGTGFQPTPLTTSPTATTKPNTTQTAGESIPDQLGNINSKLGYILTGLTGAGIIIKGIAENTTPQQQQQNAATGTCQTTQPGGCMSNLVNGAASNINNNTNNGLGNLLGLGNLGAALEEALGYLKPILDTVNATKKVLDDFVEWSKIGQVMNLLTLITSLHNAFMLSQALEQTFFFVTSDLLNTFLPFFGIDTSKKPINVQEILGKDIESFLEDTLGKQKTKAWEDAFKKVNRIYQSAVNQIFAFQNMIFVNVAALEMIGSQVSFIGNALKRYKVIGHNAFAWMNPNPNFTNNKWLASIDAVTHKITGLIGGLLAIDMIAQAVRTDEETVKQFSEAKQEILDSSKELYSDVETGLGYPENKKTAADATKSEGDSKGASPTSKDLIDVISGNINP